MEYLAPQERTVLRHLKTVGSITSVEANALHRIRSLSRRITTLRSAGHPIKAVLKQDVNKQRYARYYYMGKRV